MSQLCVKRGGIVTTLMIFLFGASQQSYSSLLCNKRQENKKSCGKAEQNMLSITHPQPSLTREWEHARDVNVMMC